MACRTFLRPGSELLVTIDTLGVKRVGLFQYFKAFIIPRIMALPAYFGLSPGIDLRGRMAVAAGPASGILSGRMVMAVAAGCTITGTGCMDLVIEQNFSGNPIKHDPDRGFRLFGGKSSIAECTDDKKKDGRTAGNLQMFYRGHGEFLSNPDAHLLNMCTGGTKRWIRKSARQTGAKDQFTISTEISFTL